MVRLISSSLWPFETHEDPVNDVDRFERNETRNFEQAGVKLARIEREKYRWRGNFSKLGSC